MFSPGNLRATFDNPAYEKLIAYYIGEKYTLRYTGGMVRGLGWVVVLLLLHCCGVAVVLPGGAGGAGGRMERGGGGGTGARCWSSAPPAQAPARLRLGGACFTILPPLPPHCRCLTFSRSSSR